MPKIIYQGEGIKTEGKPHYKMTVGGNRAYEGASTSYRMQDKGFYGGGPNRSTQSAISRLRDRSRHAVRNNAYANSALESHVTNLIGNGIKAKWNDASLQQQWDQWVNHCDADGDENFHGLQALVARGQFEAGEILTRFLTRRAKGQRIPLQLQMIESDHLDHLYDAFGQQTIRMGIQFDGLGRKTHYHLWKHHPDDPVFSHQMSRIAVKSDEVLHVFRKLRAGQIRGIPELSSVLIRLYEIDEMQDATLVRQKTSALFGWIIRKRDSGEMPPLGMPQTQEEGVESLDDSPDLSKITPGGIHYLEDDEDISFSEPADISGIYVDYLKTELRAVARGSGVTYEQLTGDLEGVNYSSIRAGLIEFRRRIEFLQLTLIVFKFCNPVADKWLVRAILYGDVPSHITLENYKQHLPEWRPPRWEWVDPLKDVQADLLEVRAGFATLASKQLERGTDPDEVTNKLMEEQLLNLVLDTNPAKVQKSGAVQQPIATQEQD